jgi:hypothetical protein
LFKLRKGKNMTKLTAADIEQAEQAQANRKQKRNYAFRAMHDRDRGWARLSNGVIIEWHTNTPLEEYVPRKRIQPGTILLDGKHYDVEEVRKWLRWA